MPRAQERAIAFGVGVFLLLIVLWAVLFGPYKNSDLGPLVLRTVLALAAAAFVGLISGKLSIQVNPGIRATGAIAAFVIVFTLNPPKNGGASHLTPATARVEHDGYLGDLHDQIQKTTADTEFVLTLSDEYKPQLRRFWIYPRITAGSNAELLRKICRAYSECLRCEPAADDITKRVQISWRSEPAPLSGDPPRYSCNATAPTKPATNTGGSPKQPEPMPTPTSALTNTAEPQKVIFGKPIYDLPADHPARRAAPTVGKIVKTSGKTCTAFLISRNQALTTAYCVTNEANMRLLLGYHSFADMPVEYPVAVIAEIDQDLNYAIVTISGNPGDDFGFLAPKSAPVAKGQTIAVIHHSNGQPLTLSDGTISDLLDPKIYYTVATAMGAGGSPIVGANGEVLGMHVGSKTRDSGASLKEGITIASIMAKSTLLKPAVPALPAVAASATTGS